MPQPTGAKITAERKLNSLLTGSAQLSAVAIPKKIITRKKASDEARQKRLELKKSRLKGTASNLPPPPAPVSVSK